MSPYVRYTVLRILLFAAVLLAGYALGMRELLLVGFALVVSAVLSYLLLGGPRQALVERLEQRTQRRHARAVARGGRVAADNAEEDAEDDARRR